MKALIVGAGKLGYKLAEAMISNGIEVTIIDTNPQKLDQINNQLDVLTINASGVQIEVLTELKINLYSFTIAATGNDETNIVICSLAKKLGCKKTIGRIRNPEYAKKLNFLKQEMGIDHIVNPELSIASEITQYLLKKYTFYSNNFGQGKVSFIDFRVNNMPNIIGKKVYELNEMKDLLITAIYRNEELIIPNGNTVIEQDDIIYIIGKQSEIAAFAKKSNISIDIKYIKKAMILGGGKIGYYLAEKLTKAGVKVKIIERDRERCEYLSEKLDKALIIHGDGSDINLLQEEDMQSMDAFISVTGYDEENLLMSLMAKQSGVKKVIAKLSRPNYTHIVKKLGVDVALNPVNISVGDILKYIRGGKALSVSLLLGEQAEVTEILVPDNTSYEGVSIEKLGLPKGVIIGAVIRKGKVIIPKGMTTIYPKDRLVIFCLTCETKALEPFLGNSKGGLFDELRNRKKSIRNFISI